MGNHADSRIDLSPSFSQEYSWGWLMGPFRGLSLRGCKSPAPMWNMELVSDWKDSSPK